MLTINPAPSCRGIAPRRKAILSHSSPQQAAGYSGRCWINRHVGLDLQKSWWTKNIKGYYQSNGTVLNRSSKEIIGWTKHLGWGKSGTEFSHITWELLGTDMVVHSSNESPQIAEHSLNLRGQAKLEFPVNIHSMVHWPPILNGFVNTSAISL